MKEIVFDQKEYNDFVCEFFNLLGDIKDELSMINDEFKVLNSSLTTLIQVISTKQVLSQQKL